MLPTTSAICLVKDQSVPFDAGILESSDGIAVVDVAGSSLLRSLLLVDTPGTNSLESAHTALTRAFLPRADLLLFVTSAEQPISESECGFLRAVASWQKRVVCVLNKADRLAAQDELDQVTEYVVEHADDALLP